MQSCYRLAAVTGMRASIASRLVALLLTMAITAVVLVVYVSETSIYALWSDAESYLKEDKLPPFPHSSVSQSFLSFDRYAPYRSHALFYIVTYTHTYEREEGRRERKERREHKSLHVCNRPIHPLCASYSLRVAPVRIPTGAYSWRAGISSRASL